MSVSVRCTFETDHILYYRSRVSHNNNNNITRYLYTIGARKYITTRPTSVHYTVVYTTAFLHDFGNEV